MPSAAKLLALSAPLLAPLARAAPLFSRAADPNDILVLKFANVLEQLENQFYQKAIAKFQAADFFDYTSPDVAVEQLSAIVADESAHESALTAALKGFGEEPLNCQFNVDQFLTDVATTMTVARLVEVTGVGAYAGAAQLIRDPRILTAAAAILPIESRHSSMLNALNGGPAVPAAFEIPLSPQGVLAIAGPLISGCDLGVKANPSLTINSPSSSVGPGDLLTFQSDAIRNQDGLFCQMVVGGHTTAVVLPIDQCKVPDGINGPVAVVITNDEQPLLAFDLVDQATDKIVAGPNFVFVDRGVKQETLANLILNNNSKLNKNRDGSGSGSDSGSNSGSNSGSSDSNNSAGGETTSTTTLTPEQASSSIDAAQSQVTDPATADPAAGGAAAPASTTFEGDIIVKMPTPAPAVNAATGIDTTGEPLPTAVDSAGEPLPTGVDSAGQPLPTDAGLPVAAGGAAGGDIVPIVPGAAPAPAPASGDLNVSVGRRRFMRRMN